MHSAKSMHTEGRGALFLFCGCLCLCGVYGSTGSLMPPATKSNSRRTLQSCELARVSSRSYEYIPSTTHSMRACSRASDYYYHHTIMHRSTTAVALYISCRSSARHGGVAKTLTRSDRVAFASCLPSYWYIVPVHTCCMAKG